MAVFKRLCLHILAMAVILMSSGRDTWTRDGRHSASYSFPLLCGVGADASTTQAANAKVIPSNFDMLRGTPLDPGQLYPPNGAYENVFVGNIKSLIMDPNVTSSSGFMTVWITPITFSLLVNMTADSDKRGEIWKFNLVDGSVSFVAGNRSFQGFQNGYGGSAVFNLPSSLGITTDSKTLYVLDNYNDMIRSIDLETNTTSVLLRLGGNASFPNITTKYPPVEKTENRTLTRNGTVLSMYSRMVFDPTADTFYVATGELIVAIDARNKNITRTYVCPIDDAMGLTLTADGRTLVIADRSVRGGSGVGAVKMMDIASGRIDELFNSTSLQRWNLPFFAPWGVALTADRRHLFVGDSSTRSKSVRLIQLAEDGLTVLNVGDVFPNQDQPESLCLARNDSVLMIANLKDDYGGELVMATIDVEAMQTFGLNSTITNGTLSSSSSPTPTPSPSPSPSSDFGINSILNSSSPPLHNSSCLEMTTIRESSSLLSVYLAISAASVLSLSVMGWGL